jgi:hypothetical protein
MIQGLKGHRRTRSHNLALVTRSRKRNHVTRRNLMKKKIYISFGIFGLMLMLSIVPAMAQHPGTIKANIPFAFTVGDKTLPAGEYTIKLPIASGIAAITIKSKDGKEAVMALADPVKPGDKAEELGLIFVKNGDKNVLFQVFVPGVELGQELLSSRKIAKSQVARVVVLLPAKKV